MISQEEQKIFDAIRGRFKHLKMVQSYRPDQLKNPNSGLNYEIDIFIKRFSVGLEYQGNVHFKEIKSIGNNPDKSRNNDVKKYMISTQDKKLTIVEIFPSDLNGDILQNIIARIENTSECYKKKWSKYIRLKILIKYLKEGKDYSRIRISTIKGKVVLTGKEMGIKNKIEMILIPGLDYALLEPDKEQKDNTLHKSPKKLSRYQLKRRGNMIGASDEEISSRIKKYRKQHLAEYYFKKNG